MTLTELQKLYPNTAAHNGVTGYIPMAFVEENLDSLKVIVKDNGLRRYYRGPRGRGFTGSTRRPAANFMVLYTKREVNDTLYWRL
jgi:hypothetical protein